MGAKPTRPSVAAWVPRNDRPTEFRPFLPRSFPAGSRTASATAPAVRSAGAPRPGRRVPANPPLHCLQRLRGPGPVKEVWTKTQPLVAAAKARLSDAHALAQISKLGVQGRLVASRRPTLAVAGRAARRRDQRCGRGGLGVRNRKELALGSVPLRCWGKSWRPAMLGRCCGPFQAAPLPLPTGGPVAADEAPAAAPPAGGRSGGLETAVPMRPWPSTGWSTRTRRGAAT